MEARQHGPSYTAVDLYASKEALDAAIASGSTGGMSAQLDELDELLLVLKSTTLPT